MTEGLAKKRGHGSFLRISGEGKGPSAETARESAKAETARESAKAAAKAEKRRALSGAKYERSFDDDSDSLGIEEHIAQPKASTQASRRMPRGSRARSKSRLLLPLSLGLGAILVVAAIALLPGALVLRRVVVAGTTSLAPGDVIAASGIAPGRPLFSNDLALAVRNLEAWAPIARAKASYVLPDALRLEIVERKAVALALVEDGSTMIPVSIDSQGFAFAKARVVDAPDLPLLSGIRFDGWKPGMRLPTYLLPTVDSIASLGRADPTLLSLFSEIRVERTNWGEVELLLFPLHHAIPVRTGPKLDASLLRSIVLVLDALDKGGVAPKVGELDFRSGTIVFRSKEGSPG